MPKYVNIAYPNEKLRIRVLKNQSKLISVRISKKEFDELVKVSKYLGISPNFFMRWVISKTANKILYARKSKKCNMMKNN